jgi:hypothetical protein
VADTWDALVESQLGEPGVAEGRMFGWACLKLGRKVYACESPDGLVVKLPEARVREEIDAGRGDEFAPMPGRVSREWVLVRDASAGRALADESRAFVAG